MSKIKHQRQAPPPFISPGKSKPQAPVMTSTTSSQHSSMMSSSRSSSLVGRKRARESDGDGKKTFRRTKSVGDPAAASMAKSGGDGQDRGLNQKKLIAIFVPSALRESYEGDMTRYNDLLSYFQPSIGATAPPSLPSLLPLLRALSAHVSLLSPDIHGGLVSAILALPWATGEERFVKVFIGFAGVLISAQPAWVKEVVNMAVQGLTWQPAMSSSSPISISRRMFHARHHLLLSHLLTVIPTLSTVLQPLLARHFPHRREAEVAQSTWIRNCCELISYCPEVGQRVWSEVVDRMLRIDLEITNIIEEEDDEDEEDEEDEDDDEQMIPTQAEFGSSSFVSTDPFDLAISEDVAATNDDDDLQPESGPDVDPDDLSSVDGDRSDEEEDEETKAAKRATQRQQRKTTKRAMRAKLDVMLFYFLEHLAETMGGKAAPAPAAELAATNIATTNSSGSSTPTGEIPNPVTLQSLPPRRPPPTPAQSLAHFQTLLHLFTRQILPTSSTQHVPFLLFLTSSLSASHTDLFLGLLVSQALYATSTTSNVAGSRPVSMSQRIASTVYIGSIVCRARFVTDEQARQVLTYLLAFIDGKMHQPKPDELQLLYAVCQAAMLIFCFRWRAFQSEGIESEGIIGEMEIEETGGESSDGKWIADLDILQRALVSDLNPLLGCNSTVVSTFAKVAHQTNFAYCFSIIEANQKSNSRSSVNNTNGDRPAASRQSSVSSTTAISIPRAARQANIDAGYDSYFPFDPYTLPRSKQYIDKLYRTWGDVSADVQDSEDEDDDGEEVVESESQAETEDTEEPDSSFPNRLNVEYAFTKGSSGSWSRSGKGYHENDALSSSMEGMSISPILSAMHRRGG